MPVIPVEASDPRLNPYRNLRSRKSNLRSRKSNLRSKTTPKEDATGFIVEGAWLVERLVASRFSVQSVLAGEVQSELASRLVQPDVPIYRLPTTEIRDVVGFHFHRGILAQGQRIENADLRSGFVDRKSTAPLRLLICPEIRDEENLGSLLRTSAAFGISGVVLSPACPDPLGRRVIRVSMGAALELPVFVSHQLSADLIWLREEYDVSLIATIVDDQAERLSPETNMAGNWGLMVGREDSGLSAEWIDHCHRKLNIAMPGGTDSLNVAVATAIMLYQLTA